MFANLTLRTTRSLFMPLMIAVMALTLLNCGGGGGGNDDSTGTPTPDINSSATQITFGNIVKNSLADRTVTIENLGTLSLNIGQIAPGQPAGAFSVPAADDNCSNKVLASGGDRCTFRVRFAPTTQNTFADTLVIPSDDPDENPLRISLSGTGLDFNVSITQIIPDCVNNEINLNVSVADDQNVPVLGLVLANFSLLENGKSVIPTSFSDTVTSQISVGIALDFSGSSGEFREEADAGAKEFISHLNFAVDPKDEAAIFKWAVGVEKTEDFTSDINALNDAIDEPFTGDNQGTALYDSLIEIVNELATRTAERRAVIVMTDGLDENASGTGPLSVNTMDQCIENANQKGIPIFAIGFGTQSAEALQQIAKGTNGQYFLAPDASQIQGIYNQIAEILTNQYKITFSTIPQDGAVITVKVDDGGSLGEDSKKANGCE